MKMLNKPLPAPYIEDPYETKQLLAKKELQVRDQRAIETFEV